ncbi:MAG: LysM peptidoglycan-binding domain-containing protein [Deltaproteobacteria bacterium]|nr:LysM peptidoglycan-binding domain-containing protein [Deltaproteobacteria bacterium]
MQIRLFLLSWHRLPAGIFLVLFLLFICTSCGFNQASLRPPAAVEKPAEVAGADLSTDNDCVCSLPGEERGLYETNVWLSEALDEGFDRQDTTLSDFLGYLEEMGASVGGSLPPSEADVEIETQARTGARYHFPMVMNAKVQRFISYYSTVQSRFMHRSLARSHRYLGMMRKILREHDVPEELAYMVLIESGFTTHAYSRARACGPWQFISSTGRRYGLKINSWVDERRDPEKATYAAAAYLTDLYSMFGSWYLAAAAYNAGEGKIQRAMRRHKTDDFWQMARFRYLKRETREYIPRLIAAIMIAKEPEKYGFADIEYQQPFTYDLVEVDAATDLQVLAWASGAKVEEIRSLNPELTYWCTPPGVKRYRLRVPDGSGPKCQLALDNLPPEKRITFLKHHIRRGETLSQIARRYHTGVRQIQELNGIRGYRIRAGHDLLIPVRVVGRGPVVFDRRIYKSGRPAMLAYPSSRKASRKKQHIVYRVRKGDSLWKISRRYRVKVTDLQRWNRMGRKTALKPGQKLHIYRNGGGSGGKVRTASNTKRKSRKKVRKKIVTLRKGDNLWLISRRYRVSVADLERWNNIRSRTILQPGQRLIVYY